MEVRCPGCRKIFYETTDKFKKDVRPNGSFIRLLDPWKTWNWDVFDGALGTSSTMCSQMNCTSCGTPLAPNGRLMIVEPEFPCPYPGCEKVCKSEAGLRGHVVTHRGNNDSRQMEPEQYTAQIG